MAFRRASDVVSFEPEFCPDAIEEWLSIIREKKKVKDGISRSDLSTRAKKHLSALGWVFWYATKGQRLELRYESPEGKCFYSLATACKNCMEHHPVYVGKLGFLQSQENSGSAFCGKDSQTSNLTTEIDSPDSRTRSGKISPESKKRKKDGAQSESGIVNNGDVVMDGGIRKSARKTRKQNDEKEKSNIMQLKRTKEDGEYGVIPQIGKSLVNLLKLVKKSEEASNQPLRSSNDMDDGICSVCYWGGDLVLCDSCPSAFHVNCVGLKGLPEEDLWFFPSCCCGMCGSGESRDEGFIICNQCQIKFHIGCLKQEIVVSYKGRFCSTKCEQVFSSLQSLVGKAIRVSDDENLVWRLVKPPEDDEYDDSDGYLNSKLHEGVKLMHDCFEPSKDPFTGRDIVEDLIFGRKSSVKRLNFSGFYTILLERNKKLATVATVRMYRDVVEIPLIATALKYRKHGLCRKLMNELERQMAELGVYKLVLSAVTSLVSTWTERFGFSVMEDYERMKLLHHSFLAFQGTVMCLKVLAREQIK